MDIPDILKIIIFDDFLKIAKKKGPPKDPIGALLEPASRGVRGAELPLGVGFS